MRACPGDSPVLQDTLDCPRPLSKSRGSIGHLGEPRVPAMATAQRPTVRGPPVEQDDDLYQGGCKMYLHASGLPIDLLTLKVRQALSVHSILSGECSLFSQQLNKAVREPRDVPYILFDLMSIPLDDAAQLLFEIW